MEGNESANPKKRKVDESPFFSKNKFAPLESMDSQSQAEQLIPNQADKPEKPPPIFINNLKNINPVLTELKSICKSPFKHLTIDKKLKLTLETIDDYRNTINYLQKSNAEYHSFQLKSDKSFRVVIRGLHPSCEVESMMDELKALGFKPKQMVPVHHPVTKAPLPLFFLDLEPNDNNEKIYTLPTLYYCKIKVEPPKPRRTVIQCLRCQAYGHSKNYCSNRPKCVKCDDDHPTDKCIKPANQPPKCVNCKGEHTASYRGCPLHKELQRNPRVTKPAQNHNPKSTNSVKIPTFQDDIRNYSSYPNIESVKDKSYANAVKESTTDLLIQKIDKLLSVISPLIDMMAQIVPILLNKK